LGLYNKIKQNDAILLLWLFEVLLLLHLLGLLSNLSLVISDKIFFMPTNQESIYEWNYEDSKNRSASWYMIALSVAIGLIIW